MLRRQPSNQVSDGAVALALFLVLTAIYVLTGTTSLQLTSDEGVNLALVESIAKFGRFDVEQMATLTRAIPAEFGLDGLHYSKYGLSQAVLSLPLYWLGMAVPSLGLIHVLLLFNALVTAAAGAFVYLVGRQLGYGVGLSVGLALVYGLATPAWVYTKRYMSEPLSSLSLILAAYLAMRAVQGRWQWALAAGIAFAVGVLNKAANAAFAPVFVAYLLLAPFAPGLAVRARLLVPAGLRRAAAFVAPVAAGLAVFAFYNYARFGTFLQTGYGAHEGFNVPIYEGLAGLLLSPGKSAFIYLPLLVLLPFWAPAFARRHRAEGYFFLALVVGHVLLYATWWIWWGGWNWGVRFLVPAWAFAVLLLAEGAHDLLGRPLARPSTFAAGLLLVASVAVQALGVAVDHTVFIASLMPLSVDPERLTLADLQYQPVVNQFQYLRIERLDFGWIVAGQPYTVDGVALGWLGAGVAGGLAALAVALRGPRLVAGLVAAVVAGIIVYGSFVHLERAYAREDGSARQMVAQLRTQTAPRAALLYLAPNLTSLWANAAKVSLPTWGTYEDPQPSAATVARLERLAGSVDEVWVVSEYPPGAPGNGLERWLAAIGFRQSERWYGPFRLASYRTDGGRGGVYSPLEARLGSGIRLAGYAVEDSERPRRPGETVNLALRWEALAPVDADYTVFVHLLDESEKVWGQQDVAPGGGYSPTGGWQPGQVVDDRYGVPVDAGAPPGVYRLEVGMYLPATGERLPVLDGSGAAVGNRVLLPVAVRVGP